MGDCKNIPGRGNSFSKCTDSWERTLATDSPAFPPQRSPKLPVHADNTFELWLTTYWLLALATTVNVSNVCTLDLVSPRILQTPRSLTSVMPSHSSSSPTHLLTLVFWTWDDLMTLHLTSSLEGAPSFNCFPLKKVVLRVASRFRKHSNQITNNRYYCKNANIVKFCFGGFLLPQLGASKGGSRWTAWYSVITWADSCGPKGMLLLLSSCLEAEQKAVWKNAQSAPSQASPWGSYTQTEKPWIENDPY